MQKNLLLLLFLSSIISFSQEKKLQYGIQLFPNFSTGIPEKDGPNSEYYHGAETFVFAYSAGFELDWNFAEKWTLSTGILYKEVGERGKVIPADLHRGFLYPHQHRFKICSIELPLNINRTIGKHILIELGVSSAITLLAKSGSDRFYEGQMNKLYRNSFGVYTNFGLGFKTIFAKYQLKIMSYAQMGILNGIYDFYYLWPNMRFFSGGIKVAFLI